LLTESVYEYVGRLYLLSVGFLSCHVLVRYRIALLHINYPEICICLITHGHKLLYFKELPLVQSVPLVTGIQHCMVKTNMYPGIKSFKRRKRGTLPDLTIPLANFINATHRFKSASGT